MEVEQVSALGKKQNKQQQKNRQKIPAGLLAGCQSMKQQSDTKQVMWDVM